MHGIWVLLVLSVMGAEAFCEEFPLETKKRAEDAYLGKDYESAFLALSELPGLLGVVPLLDLPRDHTRAEIFFDLARIRLAQRDTARARSILTYVFNLYPKVKNGILDLQDDLAFSETHSRLAQLRKQKRRQGLSSTTALGGMSRSLIVPGWGQLYRGHRKRGFVILGATAGAAVYWFIEDRAYEKAYRAYRSTQISELTLNQRLGLPADPLPFQSRFQSAQSRASRANRALGLLAGIWLAGVFDNVIIGPAHLAVAISVF